MTGEAHAEIRALAERVCPYTCHGVPCERDDHTDRDTERHWGAGVHGQGINWPTELSDQFLEQVAS